MKRLDRRTYIDLLLALLWLSQFALFFLPRLLFTQESYHLIHSPLDDLIPLWTPAAIPYYLWYIVPLALFIALMIINRKQAMENANVAKVRTKKANKVATKRMKNAGKLLAEKKSEAFYDEVLKALWGYISDKLSMPVSQLSKDNIEEELQKHQVADELIKEFINNLNECEFARYAPGNQDEKMDKIYSSAIDVISKMENSIKR